MTARASLADSNLPLNLLTEDAAWLPWSAATVKTLGTCARRVINPAIQTEVSVRFTSIEVMGEVFPAAVFVRGPLPPRHPSLPARPFSPIGGTRRSPRPDVFIGAHAAIAGHRLLTRDPARYRARVPRLELIAPT